MNQVSFTRRRLIVGAFATATVFGHSWTALANPKPNANANAPILVLNSLNANVSVIDPVTWTEIKRVPVGKEPHHLYLTPD
jgi:YVTN family beta-propeller protein